MVFKTDRSSLSLSIDGDFNASDLDDDGNELLHVVKLANDATYKRLKKAVDKLEAGRDVCSLHNVLFGVGSPSPPAQNLPPAIADADGNLSFINGAFSFSPKQFVTQ